VQLSVEREWPARLCGADSDGLARLNARFRACDMSALLLAPALVGLLATFAGINAAAVAVIVFSCACWPAQIWLLRHLSASVPALLQAPSAPPAPSEVALSSGASQALRPLQSLRDGAVAMAATWSQSLRNPVFPAALSLSMLYGTVLSLGYILVGFMVASGVTEAVIAGFRGAGGAAGFAATAAFPLIRRHLGLRVAGALGIGTQLLALAAATLPLLLRDGVADCGGTPPTAALYALLSGVALSRWGLWLFDLAVSQHVQERVPPGQLSAFLGVQSSLSAAFEILSYAVTISAPSPCRFPGLAAASLGFVAAAAALYLCAGGRGTSAASKPAGGPG
jgi:iron-regulated transporter 1